MGTILSTVIASVLLAFSMCADCFAVCAASSVTLGARRPSDILPMALSFGIVQAGLFIGGYLSGNIFVGFIQRAAHWVGFILLLYVGGNMLLGAVRDLVHMDGKKDGRHIELRGIRNVLLGAVATSMDALAVGVSLSFEGRPFVAVASDCAAIFVVTVLSVFLGVMGGAKAGEKYGSAAQVVGGIVLLGIGIAILLGGL